MMTRPDLNLNRACARAFTVTLVCLLLAPLTGLVQADDAPGGRFAKDCRAMEPGFVFVAGLGGEVHSSAHPDGLPVRELIPFEPTRLSLGPRGALVLVFSNRTSVFLGPGTVAELVAFEHRPYADLSTNRANEPTRSRLELRVTVGRLGLDRAIPNPATELLVHLPEGTARVLGQRFTLLFQGQQRRLYNLDGQINVTPAGGGPGIIIPGSEFADFAEGNAGQPTGSA